MSIHQASLPPRSLLANQANSNDHLDCFAVVIPGNVTLEAYVAAFYTTWLFKLERFILRLAGQPSTDAQALALARGERQEFAFWKQEARDGQELLMRDLSGVTCSWLMVDPTGSGTRLYFGSGVRARQTVGQASSGLAWSYRALMGLHMLYSRALLATAARRIQLRIGEENIKLL
jgi:hypothetical protein